MKSKWVAVDCSIILLGWVISQRQRLGRFGERDLRIYFYALIFKWMSENNDIVELLQLIVCRMADALGIV